MAGQGQCWAAIHHRESFTGTMRTGRSTRLDLATMNSTRLRKGGRWTEAMAAAPSRLGPSMRSADTNASPNQVQQATGTDRPPNKPARKAREGGERGFRQALAVSRLSGYPAASSAANRGSRHCSEDQKVIRSDKRQQLQTKRRRTLPRTVIVSVAAAGTVQCLKCRSPG